MPQTPGNELRPLDRLAIEGSRKTKWNNLFQKWTQQYGLMNEVAPQLGNDDEEDDASLRKSVSSSAAQNLPGKATQKRTVKTSVKRKRKNEPAAVIVNPSTSKGANSKRSLPARNKKSLGGVSQENSPVNTNGVAVQREKNQLVTEHGSSGGDVIANSSEGVTTQRKSLRPGKNSPANATQKRLLKSFEVMEKKKKPSAEIVKSKNSKGASSMTSHRPRSTRRRKLVVESAEKITVANSKDTSVDREENRQALQNEPSNENLIDNALESVSPMTSTRPKSTRRRKLIVDAAEKSTLANSTDIAVDREENQQTLQNEPLNENPIGNSPEESSIRRNRIQSRKQRLVQRRDRKQAANVILSSDESEVEFIWAGKSKTGVEFVETPRGKVRRWFIEPYF